VLDYLWAGLPMVLSSGDTLSRQVAAQDLGYVVAPGDVDGLAAVILRMAGEQDRRERRAAGMAALREQYCWEQTLAPLVEFCRKPRHAPDAQRQRLAGQSAQGGQVTSSPDLLKRMNRLDQVVEEKNAHIAELKQLIERLESGQVMRLLRTVDRLRQRGS
jgi:hypothetical protein